MGTIIPAETTADRSAIEALFDQLQHLDGKAEIVDGGIVIMSPTQPWPGEVAAEIYSALRSYARKVRRGWAVTDGQTFRVDLPHRESFSPDAAYHIGGRHPQRYYEGAPVFAAEVRSLGDYGPRAERLQAEKREDYFACGTQVVWDVDLRSNDVIRMYLASNPGTPVVFRPGVIAHAEPAVPGWTVPVNELLPEDWEPPQ